MDRAIALGRAFAPLWSFVVLLAVVAYPVALFYGGFLVPALGESWPGVSCATYNN